MGETYFWVNTMYHTGMQGYQNIVLYSQETGQETGLGEIKGTTGYFGGGVAISGVSGAEGT